MAKGNKKNAKMKDVKHYPKMENELTYFLDHPDIKREECIGNGSAPGSIGAKINWGGQGTASPAPQAPAAPQAPSATPAGSSPSLAEKINFGGKYKK